MTKHMKNVVRDTQQEIRTTVEQDNEELKVKIRACSALDDELRSEFRDDIDALETGSVSTSTRTYRSNQGNELGEDVTVRFAPGKMLQGIDVVDGAIQLGKDYYEKQLERELAREADSDSDYHTSKQLLYFDDDDLKEFCFLFQGRVEI